MIEPIRRVGRSTFELTQEEVMGVLDDARPILDGDAPVHNLTITVTFDRAGRPMKALFRVESQRDLTGRRNGR